MSKILLIGAGVAALVIAPNAAFSQEVAKTYPVCSTPGQDSCQNPGEGGAPGHSRAADYAGGPPVYTAGSEASPLKATDRRHHSRKHHHGSRSR
jgi:hypothetical protein